MHKTLSAVKSLEQRIFQHFYLVKLSMRYDMIITLVLHAFGRHHHGAKGEKGCSTQESIVILGSGYYTI